MACADCHVDGQYREMESECRVCHEEPEAHAGRFGVRCSSCHTPAGWEDAAMSAHRFPLDHALGTDVPCVACHTNDVYTAYSCESCHEHVPAAMRAAHIAVDLGATELNECTACHTKGTPEETERLRTES